MFIKRVAAVIFAGILIFGFSGCAVKNETTVYSEEHTGSVTVQTAEDVSLDGASDSALAAIVYCADNDEVLYGHNINDKRAIASITKIMTAVVALEYASSLDKEVKITPEMYAEGSSMYLKEGEIIRLSELVKGMMAVSGNDAANAVALTVGGSDEKFADMMNEKAKQIGMKNTHFVTPSGLDNEQHYSTAYDMALLCAYAMENDSFKDIVSQKNIQVSYVDPESKTQTLTNHNRLLSLCEGCIGIKTGFTKKAGRTLCSCTERDGVRLIVVTLNDGNDWNDHCNLYDKCFPLVKCVKLADQNKTIELPLVGGNSDSITLSPEREISAVLKNEDSEKVSEKLYAPRFIYAPAEKGEYVGRIEYYVGDRMISTVRLRIDE